MADALPDELTGLLQTTDPTAREAAWTAFVKAHSRLLLHACRTLGRDYDAAMDAYAYLLEQLRKDDFHRLRAYAVDGRSKFTTWLVVVARRVCLDRLRQRYGRSREGTAPEARATRRRLADLVAAEIDLARLGDDAGANPESELIARERSALVMKAVGELAPRDRLLLKLRFEDDLSAREIGRVMGFPTPFHVYRRINTVLAALRLSLEREGLEGAGA